MDITRLVQDIVDTRFRDFAGLRLSVTVPIRDSLINELVGKILASATAAPAPPPAGAPPAGPTPAVAAPAANPAASATSSTAAAAPATSFPGLPTGLRITPADIAPLIRKASIRAEAGRVVLEIDIAVE